MEGSGVREGRGVKGRMGGLGGRKMYNAAEHQNTEQRRGASRWHAQMLNRWGRWEATRPRLDRYLWDYHVHQGGGGSNGGTEPSISAINGGGSEPGG